MSISSFTTEIPRRLETLKRISLDFTVQTANGELSHLDNTSGKIVATFPPESPRHATDGSVTIQEGNAKPVLDVTPADIQIEQGAPEAGWPGAILGAIVVQGSEQGTVWAGRSTGPVGETSLGFEMAISNANGKKAQQAELKAWLTEGGISFVSAPVVIEGDFDPLLAAWIKAQGINVDALSAFIRKMGAKAHAQNAAEKVVEWIAANVVSALNPQTVLAIALASIAEIKSGKPGFNPDHPGLA